MVNSRFLHWVLYLPKASFDLGVGEYGVLYYNLEHGAFYMCTHCEAVTMSPYMWHMVDI